MTWFILSGIYLTIGLLLTFCWLVWLRGWGEPLRDHVPAIVLTPFIWLPYIVCVTIYHQFSRG